MDLMQGEHKSPEYRAIAPNAKVPALVLDDETIITESTAICRYLEDLYPEPSLFGSSSIEKAAIEMWQNRVVFELMLPLAMTFRHTHPAMAQMENQNASYGEQQRDVALGSLKYFDKHLADSEYIAGDAFTFADIQVQWLENVGKIGVTAGASAPEILVQQVVSYLLDNGANEVVEVSGANESVHFPVPNTLRV